MDRDDNNSLSENQVFETQQSTPESLVAGGEAVASKPSFSGLSISADKFKSALNYFGIAAATAALALSIFNTVKMPKYDGQDRDMHSYVQAEINRYFAMKEAVQIAKNLEPFESVVENQPKGKAFYGSPTARFTLVEFSDLECPYCKKFHHTPKELVDTSKGLVNWEWVNNPLEMHNPAAQVEAIAVECIRQVAGNKAYWASIGAIFNMSSGNGGGVANIGNIAKFVGADPDQFNQCLKSAKTLPVLQTQQNLAQAKGINSTPYSILVDNKTGQQYHIQGMQDLDSLQSVIRQALEKDEAVPNPIPSKADQESASSSEASEN